MRRFSLPCTGSHSGVGTRQVASRYRLCAAVAFAIFLLHGASHSILEKIWSLASGSPHWVRGRIRSAASPPPVGASVVAQTSVGPPVAAALVMPENKVYSPLPCTRNLQLHRQVTAEALGFVLLQQKTPVLLDHPPGCCRLACQSASVCAGCVACPLRLIPREGQRVPSSVARSLQH